MCVAFCVAPSVTQCRDGRHEGLSSWRPRKFVAPSQCRAKWCAALSGSSGKSGPQGEAGQARLLPGTPCFTEHLTATPMPNRDRDAYVNAAANSVVSYVADEPGSGPRVGSMTLLLPQLNPELDVFDRRFVLRLVWAVVNALCFEAGLRTRVLVQGVGKYGAVPLSVAGLRKTFEADMRVSADLWGGEEAMERILRCGDLENPKDVSEDDEAFVVITPANATGMAVVEDVIDLVERVGSKRPVILLNPRLADIPSAAGVMGVCGRAHRVSFLEGLVPVFYLKLLYDSGSQYPLRGILYHEYSKPWQMWRPESSSGETGFRLIGEFAKRPSSSDMTESVAVDRRKRRLDTAGESPGSLDSILAENIPAVLVAIALASIATLYFYFGQGILP